MSKAQSQKAAGSQRIRRSTTDLASGRSMSTNQRKARSYPSGYNPAHSQSRRNEPSSPDTTLLGFMSAWANTHRIGTREAMCRKAWYSVSLSSPV